MIDGDGPAARGATRAGRQRLLPGRHRGDRRRSSSVAALLARGRASPPGAGSACGSGCVAAGLVAGYGLRDVLGRERLRADHDGCPGRHRVRRPPAAGLVASWSGSGSTSGCGWACAPTCSSSTRARRSSCSAGTTSGPSRGTRWRRAARRVQPDAERTGSARTAGRAAVWATTAAAHQQRSRPTTDHRGDQVAAASAARRPWRRRRSPPVTRPPRWPAREMPGTNEIRRLITSSGMIDEVSRPSRRSTTKSAANRPKIAPDAPTVPPVGREHVAGHAAAEPGHQVEHGEAHRPERRLERPAEHPQRPHVHRQVNQSIVEEHVGEQAVVLAVGHPGRQRSADRLPTRSGRLADDRAPAR